MYAVTSNRLRLRRLLPLLLVVNPFSIYILHLHHSPPPSTLSPPSTTTLFISTSLHSHLHPSPLLSPLLSPPPLTSTPHLHSHLFSHLHPSPPLSPLLSPPPLTSIPHLHPSPPPLTSTLTSSLTSAPHLHPSPLLSPPPLTSTPHQSHLYRPPSSLTLVQVGRPNNVPQAAAIITSIHEEASKYNRIYVASIHLDLTEADIMRWACGCGRGWVGITV